MRSDITYHPDGSVTLSPECFQRIFQRMKHDTQLQEAALYAWPILNGQITKEDGQVYEDHVHEAQVRMTRFVNEVREFQAGTQ